MLKPAEFFSSTLANGVKASEDTITLCRGHAQALDAVGIGRPNQGVIAETRGERVRVYRSEPLRAESATAVRRAIAEGDPAWPDQVPPEVEAWIRTEGLYRRP